MIGRTKVAERPATLAEVRDILKARAKEGELGFEQSATLEYAEKFTKLSGAKAKELRKALEDLGSLPPEVVSKAVDLLPSTVAELRLLYSKTRFNLNEQQTKEVLDLVAKYK